MRIPLGRQRRPPSGRAVLALAFALLAAPAAPATAATVAYTQGVVKYWAAPSEVNDLSVAGAGGYVVLTERSATLTAGRGCAATGDGSVACGSPESDLSVRLEIYLRAGDDRVDAETLLDDVTVYSGKGADVVHSGSGAGGRHTLDGGSGADMLSTATNVGGLSVMTGGPDDDVLDVQEGGEMRLSGGGGNDELRASGDVGGPLDGGSGNDTYVLGDAVALSLVLAGPGVDTLSLEAVPALVDLLSCASCVERIVGSPGDDALFGDGAANTILAGEGADVVDPRGGADSVDAAAGDDVVLTRDGVRDAVTCGEGADRVVADGIDDVDFGSCETIFRGEED